MICTGQHISVIVPCYNASRTILETLGSVVGETGIAEIIVIDDGSSDDSVAIARSFEPQVRIIAGPNGGASKARNIGIAASQAPWIVFLDADDLILPGSLALRLETAANCSADVVICDWEELVDDGSGKVSLGDRRSLDWAAVSANTELATATSEWATTAAILYRRELVDRIGGFRPDLPVIQDARFLFDAAYHGGRFAHAAHIGARYRRLAGSLSRRDPSQFWRDVLLNGLQIEKVWRGRTELSEAQLAAVAGIYDVAARGLFAAADPAFFEAVARRRNLSVRETNFGRVATPLARLIGLRWAKLALSRLTP
jgi:glycosyltransferase involved in cell wall biosynthesis